MSPDAFFDIHKLMIMVIEFPCRLIDLEMAPLDGFFIQATSFLFNFQVSYIFFDDEFV